LRIADFSSADLGGERYGLGAWTFEVAPCGDDWLLGLSRRGVRQQLARFDREFRNGEILVSREMAEQECFPLRSPLDEWIVLHRTVARGGLVLNGSKSCDGSGSGVPLGSDASGRLLHHRRATSRMALMGRNTVVLREEGAQLRSFRTPWSDFADPLQSHSGLVADLTIVEETERPYRECLDPDEAAEQLVAHAVIPLCDENLFDRVLYNARRMAEQVTVVRVGEVAQSVALTEWPPAQLQNAVAPPSLGL
jgi:hypothetical protein